MDVRIEEIESGVHRLQSDLEGQRNATYRLNEKLEASTEATQNLSSLLQCARLTEWRETDLALRLQRQMAIAKPQSSAQLRILQQDALQLLRVNDHAVVQDLHSMLHQSRSIDHRLQSQA